MQPRIGIIIGTTRAGRFADQPARWIEGIAQQRTDMEFETLDLRDFPLPFFDEPQSPLWSAPKHPIAQRWAAVLARCDGFIIITAEYNHAPSGVLKNALDYAYAEFVRKPVAYVGYGGVGAARAIEQLRAITAELQMVSVQRAVHIGLMEFLGVWQQGKAFEDYPHLGQAATAMLDDLAWWTKALRAARSATEQDQTKAVA
jgi:NAD(P)H-dependent FMN reductase